MITARFYLAFLLLIAAALFYSCSSEKSGTDQDEFTSDFGKVMDTIKPEPRAIYYHMSLPVEMARLFEQVGANYYPDLLNSDDNLSRYDTRLKQAMNLGVYGVDLSYVKMYDRKQSSVLYLGAIHRLSEELELPSDLYGDLLSNLEKYVSNKDSLAAVSVEIYQSVDRYLKEQGEDYIAMMIIMGGWVEALFISTQIYKQDLGNITLLEKIAEQKYSLNSMISLINNYQDNVELAEYLLMLKNLRRSFNKFEIYYARDDVAVDTINKMISASKYYINVTPAQIHEIGDKVASIRDKIVR